MEDGVSSVVGGAGSCSDNSGLSSSSSPPVTREHLNKRIESLQQQNKVLKCEVETYKLRVKALLEENRNLRQASVSIQAKAEQEEEFISNTLLKKIQALKKEKEILALNYEQEEECLTNDLSRKLNQLRQEKVQLEYTLEQEQECLVNKLMRRIEKLESETTAKQTNLETLRREKIELENTLEQEQEALVNKLWKRMDRLETEKRSLQVKLDQPVSEPPSPRTYMETHNGDTAANLANNIHALRQECARLKQQLSVGKMEQEKRRAETAREEREIREENLRLQRKLQLEVERREALCRHLSESESSLEMEEERVYNEMTSHVVGVSPAVAAAGAASAPPTIPLPHRTRTVSSPVPVTAFSATGPSPVVVGPPSGPSPGSSRPLSPGLNYGEPRSRDSSGIFSPPSPLTSLNRLHHGITSPPGAGGSGVLSPSPPPGTILITPTGPPGAAAAIRRQHVAERFVKPVNPTSHPAPAAAAAVAIPTTSTTTTTTTTSDNEAKPPASPMDTSDNSTNNNNVNNSNVRPMSK